MPYRNANICAMRVNHCNCRCKKSPPKIKSKARTFCGTKSRCKGGQVLESQSPWRLSFITDAFWAFINFFVLFFQTMFDPNKNNRGESYTSDYRKPGGGGPPTRRMGGFRGGRGGPSAPPMAGGG